MIAHNCTYRHTYRLAYRITLFALLAAACGSTPSASGPPAEPAGSRTLPSNATTPTSATTTTLFGGPPNPSAWNMVFADEFDGTALDKSRWATCYFFSATSCTNSNTKEIELFQPGNVSVSDGLLTLTARKEPAYYDNKSFEYTSGMVSGVSPTETFFSFQYGYVDARARVPAGQGLWSAFWMLPIDRTSLPEIDIFEVYGQHPDIDNQTTHWSVGGEDRQQGHRTRTDDLSAGWHDFGLQWDRNQLIWFLDGRPIWRQARSETIPHTEMYLLADLAVGGEFGGPPNAETRFPSSLVFDYVRVWQRR